MAVYVTGDTHGGMDMHKLSSKVMKNHGVALNEGDYLIILGDFGFPFLDKDAEQIHGEYTYWMKWLADKPYTILWIDGNHDNFNFWGRQPVSMWHGGRVQVHPKANNVFHLMRGEIYEIEGEKYFVFGGARSQDKEYRVPDVSWWYQEEASNAEILHAQNNLMKCDYAVDYILTHTPPAHIIRAMPELDYKKDRTADFLEDVSHITDYKLWCCGHLHEDLLISDQKLSIHYQSVCSVSELRQKINSENRKQIQKEQKTAEQQGFIL